MFNVKEVYAKDNEAVFESYNESLVKIKEIYDEILSLEISDKEVLNYFDMLKELASFIMNATRIEKEISEEYYSKSWEELQKDNHSLYSNIFPENYETSYNNPEFNEKVFGEKFGKLISFLFDFYQKYIRWVSFHKIFYLEQYNKLFIEIYDYIKKQNIEYEELKSLITKYYFQDRTKEYHYNFIEKYDKNFKYYQDIIENSDLSDLRYLFRAGKYIGPNEKRISEFMQKYPEDELRTVAKIVVDGYIQGFKDDSKDITKKSTVGLFYKIGLEKLYLEIIKGFREHNLECTVAGVYSTKINEQNAFDHQHDLGLILNENFKKNLIMSYENALESNKENLSEYSGIVYIENFGRAPFSPKMKTATIKLDADQQNLYKQVNMEMIQLSDKYSPRAETSFCIIAFPTPEIGDNFEKIFEETIKINKLESLHCQNIQQKMIDILDTADTVHIKGKGENKTDLIVKLPKLKDATKETNFVNGGASVNIPVGEIFTSPQLTGTNGVLHVDITFQNGLRYDNLLLNFKDGFVSEYSCTNFDNEEENNKYIEQNLLFPHKTLPMGEFAIGTNTLAYVMSRKYDIMDVLPVLIMEKTGPHFAIGDTCFSQTEDHAVFNPLNSKEVTARDNEKSIKRKTDMNEAYTFKHNDITLAFDDILFITAIRKNGEKIDIIRDGRFVVPGTEELNEPLDNQ